MSATKTAKKSIKNNNIEVITTAELAANPTPAVPLFA